MTCLIHYALFRIERLLDSLGHILQMVPRILVGAFRDGRIYSRFQLLQMRAGNRR
ncbi:hypothetical protein D3C87_1856260 [compost metagenome]